MNHYVGPGDPMDEQAQMWLDWAAVERYKPGADPIWLSWHAKMPLRDRLRRWFARR